MHTRPPLSMAGVERLAKALQSYILEIVLAELAVCTVLGSQLRGGFAALKPLIPVLTFALLLQPMYALEAEVKLLHRLRAKARGLAASILLYAAVYPLVTFALAQLWVCTIPYAGDMLTGVLLVALSPVAMPAPAFTSLSGGDVELSIATVVLTFALAPVVMPLYSSLLLHQVVPVPLRALLWSIAVYIAVPFVAAQALRAASARLLRRGGGRDPLEAPLGVVSCIALYAIVAIAFGNAAPLVLSDPAAMAAVIALLLLYNGARYLAAYAASRLLGLSREEGVAVIYAASQNGALGMALALGVAGIYGLIGAVLAGPVAVLLSMSIVAKILARRA